MYNKDKKAKNPKKNFKLIIANQMARGTTNVSSCTKKKRNFLKICFISMNFFLQIESKKKCLSFHLFAISRAISFSLNVERERDEKNV